VGGWGTAKDNFIILEDLISEEQRTIGDLSEQQRGQISIWTQSGNIRDKRSFRSETEKIWENCEPSPEPYIPCYTPRRLKGGERSEAKSEGF